MPLWSIFHPAGTFEDDATRKALAEDITKIYTGVGLPPFYVVVNFHKLENRDTYVGGEHRTEKPFIRFVIKQIAVRLPNSDAEYQRMVDRVTKTLKPHIADKGYDSEFHIEETERRLWRINDIDPPPHPSEAEERWFRENKATPWE